MDVQKRIDQFQNELDKLKKQVNPPEFEEGQWIAGDKGALIKYYPNPLERGGLAGFNMGGTWGEEWYINFTKEEFAKEVEQYYRPATKEEIKKALVPETRRREYKPGNFECLSFWGSYANPAENNDEYDYYITNDVLFLGSDIVYKRGQWAEKIEDDIVINGVKVTPEDDRIELGCADMIGGTHFVYFYQLIKDYDLKVSREGEDITPQIHKIAERYE